MILPVPNISPIPMPAAVTTGASGASAGSGDFQSILQGSIGSIQSLQNDANTAVQKFLTGENEELHTTVLAMQRAELAFELGLQVRNKVVSAYQEIMKMQL
jgi:flagellar hook-basal body complex protein FliE